MVQNIDDFVRLLRGVAEMFFHCPEGGGTILLTIRSHDPPVVIEGGALAVGDARIDHCPDFGHKREHRLKHKRDNGVPAGRRDQRMEFLFFSRIERSMLSTISWPRVEGRLILSKENSIGNGLGGGVFSHT
jgi:hypothetical protein